MVTIKVNPKIAPYDIHGPTAGRDKFLDKGFEIIRRLASLIFLQALLGINRVYLLRCSTLVTCITYTHAFFLFGLTCYVLCVDDSVEKSYVLFKETAFIEYIVLILISTWFHRKTFVNFFRDIAAFDDMLNISGDIKDTVPLLRAACWIASSIIYTVIEIAMLYVYLFDYSMEISFAMVYLVILAHDSEQILFNTMIRMIMLRVRVVKAHIAKAFSVDNVSNDSKGIEALANNTRLDTIGMHRAYELLHKCAEELNSVMSFPMIVMIFSSGLSTTLLLKRFFQLTQENNGENVVKLEATMIYMLFRCLKYTLLVIIPCYNASVTSGQVSIIRTMLHNAVNTFKLEKIERRKIKAFFQLTQDNEFAYALWGVIRLNMSLPLNYASLCTTYLVISIQFSKFID